MLCSDVVSLAPTCKGTNTLSLLPGRDVQELVCYMLAPQPPLAVLLMQGRHHIAACLASSMKQLTSAHMTSQPFVTAT